MTQKTKLIPVAKWKEYHPWPSESGLRNLIRLSKDNGFNKVIVRVNKRILIDEDAFFQWVKSKQK